MKIRNLLIIILFLSFLKGYSQPQHANTDSIAVLLKKAVKEDSNKVKLLIEYSKCFFPSDLDRSSGYFNQAITISRKIGYKVGEIRGMNGLASCYWQQEKTALCIETFHKALYLAQEDKNYELQTMVAENLGIYYFQCGLSDSAERYQRMALVTAKKQSDKNKYAIALAEMGTICSSKGQYLEAIQYYLEAKNIYETLHNYSKLASVYTKMGILYYDLMDFNNSILSYRLALKIYDSIKDYYTIIRVLQNIGVLYTEVKVNNDSARYYTNLSLKMAREQKQDYSILTCLTNLGNIAFNESDFNKAIEIYLEVSKSPIINSRNLLKAGILVNLGTSYLNLGDIAKAEKFASEGLKLAQDQKFMTFEKTACRTMAMIMEKKKDYKSAFGYNKRDADLQDTLGNTMVKQKVAEAVFQNSLKQQENENLLLQKDNELKIKTIEIQRFYIILIIVVLLLGILLVFVLIRNSHREHILNQILDTKNKELQDLNLTKDKFYSVIAHDLKSPFNALLGLLNDLDENYSEYDEDSKRNILRELKISSHNTYNLLVNLLEWTLLQRGTILYSPQETNIKEVANEVLSILSSRATVKRQNIINEVHNTLTVVTDPQILKSILLNLVNNAIKFTPEEGMITIKSMKNGDNIRVEIADNGIGIPESGLKKIFRIDTKYQRMGTANEPGTGLGLLMTKEFVTVLGGEIGVSSEEGKGSVFYFTVPEVRILESHQ